MGNCASAENSPPISQKKSSLGATANRSGSGGNRRNSGSSRRSRSTSMEEFRQNASKGDLCVFTYGEMAAATKNFRPDKILGAGGFGVAGIPLTQVAVKELNPEGCQGDDEWLAEVNHLGQLSHPNLVKLIGYCCEDDHRLLVYEFMACGSLEKHLFRRVCLPLSWSTRLKIALGTAKGLAFLHGAERPSSTGTSRPPTSCWTRLMLSLLDDPQEYNAKLSDFGLAKEGPTGDETHVSTRVMGTHGYAAPEYVMTGRLTARSDVYGYGVVLLEMMTGGGPWTGWARPLLVHNRKLMKIVDPRMEGQYATGTIQMVARLAYGCLSQNPKHRPTMQQVVQTLELLSTLPENMEYPLLDGGRGAVTLYEAPMDAAGGACAEQNKCLDKTKSEIDSVVRRQSGSRTRGGKGRRVKSEVPVVYELGHSL
ncbi:unnamed protein product [Spirodela intermedia]|uniref:Protein kinase domain-containing protein n=1 Tax=Spirodela intermedia TaxID=51605 RepID=A0A7I8JM87_SPIIN|nr:unnamed protein product [Spirodela intermedia]CAA6671210.1 unnamed protein product [Spirodela intermedia]